MKWQECFKVIRLKPGRVITPLFGELDLSNPNIPLEKIQALFEADAYYLQLTPLGEKTLYSIDNEQLTADSEQLPVDSEQPPATNQQINESTNQQSEISNSDSQESQPSHTNQQSNSQQPIAKSKSKSKNRKS